jgi:hypothetical protein
VNDTGLTVTLDLSDDLLDNTIALLTRLEQDWSDWGHYLELIDALNLALIVAKAPDDHIEDADAGFILDEMAMLADLMLKHDVQRSPEIRARLEAIRLTFPDFAKEAAE